MAVCSQTRSSLGQLSTSATNGSRLPLVSIPRADIYRFGHAPPSTPLLAGLEWNIQDNPGEAWAVVGHGSARKTQILEVCICIRACWATADLGCSRLFEETIVSTHHHHFHTVHGLRSVQLVLTPTHQSRWYHLLIAPRLAARDLWITRLVMVH
jgi:hypothetical protein